LDAHYVDVAVRRWEAYTGKKAVHEGRGISFEECEEAARGPVDVS
jgi:hypothetical protein